MLSPYIYRIVSQKNKYKKFESCGFYDHFQIQTFEPSARLRNPNKNDPKTGRCIIWQSQRESNPCYRNENPMS